MKVNLNIYSSIAITLFNSLTFFILYKLILIHLGLEALGLWAIIIGFTSILSQSTAAVNTNIIREIAESDEQHYIGKASELILNGLVIYLLFFFLLSIVVNISLFYIFKEKYNSYLELISLTLFAIFINLLATVFSSILDARKLNYIKNSAMAVGNIVFLVICFFSIKKFGLIGVAIAQIAQASFLFFCILYFVFIRIRLRIIWNEVNFKNIHIFFKESWKLQGISLLVLCYEPITKYFLSKFGLTYVAKYEIANKIIAQLRNIFAVTNQTLLAYFVNKFAEGKTVFISYFNHVSNKNLQWSLIANGILLIAAPIISLFFLKELDMAFFIIFVILLISNLFNIVSITTYFNLFAQKQYHTPFISHIIIALLNVVLSFVLGYFFNGIGVVIAWSISLIVGSIFNMYKFNKTEEITFNFKNLWNSKLSLLLVSLIIVVAVFKLPLLINYFFIVIATIIFLYLYQAFKLYKLND